MKIGRFDIDPEDLRAWGLVILALFLLTAILIQTFAVMGWIDGNLLVPWDIE